VFAVEQSTDTDGNPAIKFTLGGTEGHTNKINFTIQAAVSSVPGSIIKFPITEFSAILSANKESIKEIIGEKMNPIRIDARK
jgi:hypothetical protein